MTILYELLSEMLNHAVNEDSTAGSAVRSSPYSDQLIRTVHKELAMGHNIQWKNVGKISWSDIKTKSPNFIIIAGTNGTAAIRWGGGVYTALVSYDEGITKHQSENSNSIMTYVKAGIGKTTGFWVSSGTGSRPSWGRIARHDTGDVEAQRNARADSQKITTNIFDPSARYEQNFDALVRKLKPLWLRNIQQAIADLKGAAGISIKNDAFARAIKKMEYANRLQELYNELQDSENSSDIPEKITASLKHAVIMTAGYYYPELTGEIGFSHSRYNRGAGVAYSDNSAGAQKVIQDVASGDQEKMVMIMAYFKQVLLHP